jgi:ATP-dependent helicase Lhr and Lhr-like helicase
VQVEPTDAPGVARWLGGGPLGAHVARGIRAVLCGVDPAGVELSERAAERLNRNRTEHWWADAGATTIVRDRTGKTHWWTFAGWKANLWLAAIGSAAGLRKTVTHMDDLAISLDEEADATRLRTALQDADPSSLVLAPWITAEAVDGLKFSECLPRARATELVVRRLADPLSVALTQSERVTVATAGP